MNQGRAAGAGNRVSSGMVSVSVAECSSTATSVHIIVNGESIKFLTIKFKLKHFGAKALVELVIQILLLNSIFLKSFIFYLIKY